MILMILLITLILLLVLPAISYAGGGGGSTTVDAVGPKSEELLGLEKQFYNLANMTMGAYTNPLNSMGQQVVYPTAAQTTPTAQTTAGANQTASQGKAAKARREPVDQSGDTIVSAGKGAAGKSPQIIGGSPLYLGKDGTVSQGAASNGKGGSSGTLIPQPYDNDTLMGQLFNDATKKTYVSNQRYDDLMGQAPGLSAQSQTALGQMNNMLGQGADAVNQSKTAGDWYFDQAKGDYGNAQNYLAQAGTAGDPWYQKAMGAYDSAQGLLGQMQGNLNYTSQANKWYDDFTRDMLGGSKNLLETGEIPKPIMDALLSSMTTGVNQSVGSNLNDLASRGVINSSVANRGMSDMSKAVADSMNENYLNSFNTILGGYNQTADTAANAGKTFADVNLNINNSYDQAMRNAIGLGDSYGNTGHMRVSDLLGVAGGYTDNANSLMGAGSQRINDWLNVAQGYNQSAAGYGDLSSGYLSNLDMNLKEREALQNDISKYYTNAAAPMMPAYDLLKTMQMDHVNSNKKDTIVKQGK